jgi:pimeloyl-ACP methyl ester carboxylesterase
MQRLNPIHLTGALRHCYLWATSGWSDEYKPNPDADPEHPLSRTIYCIHGTADRASSFSLIAERLQGKLPSDIKGIHIITFNNRFSGAAISDFSQQLSERISKNRDENVVLMGHSRGALVAADYALNHAKQAGVFVDSIFSICGPLRGSYAAWPASFFSQSAAEMQIDSTYLKQLSEQIQQSKIKFLFVGAMNDYLVTGDSFMPYGTDINSENVLLLDRHGHLSVASSHRLVERLAIELATSRTLEMQPVNNNEHANYKP